MKRLLLGPVVRGAVAGIIVATAFVAASAHANLLSNPGFEVGPGGEGVMPSDWLVINESPDTYSNDGSNGLLPSIFGNFTGVTAHGGIRWVAGWSSFSEIFAQLLTAPLAAGQSYSFSGYLHQALRSDLDNRGGYMLSLAADTALAGNTVLGSFGPTADTGGWEFFSLGFIAPSNAGSLPYLVFTPYDSTGITDSAYPGLDDVNLAAGQVPEPMTLALLGLGLAGIGVVRRRRARSG